MVVLTLNHAAQAGKEAFGHVGMLAVIGIGFRVVDAVYLPSGMKSIPMPYIILDVPKTLIYIALIRS